MTSRIILRKGYEDTGTGEAFSAWVSVGGWRLRMVETLARALTAAKATVMLRAGYACLGLAALTLCASLSGCGGAGQVEARAGTVGAAVAPVATEGAAKRAAHLCGAATVAGGTCKRRVRREGLRCWMHGGPGKAELDAAGAQPKQ